MALFALQLDSCPTAVKYMDDTNRRLQSVNYIRNPFTGGIKKFVKKGIYVFDVKPIYFNFSIFGWLGAAGLFWVWGFTPWLIPFVGVGLLGFFWWSRFFSWVAIKGLRKAGYQGNVVVLRRDEIIEKVIF